MCSLDIESWSTWRNTPRFARKDHECDSCGTTIHPREPYLDHFHAFDGSAASEDMCFVCWLALEQFAAAHGSYFAPSELTNFLQECIGTNDDEEDEWRPVLAVIYRRWRISPGGRRQLQRGIEDHHARLRSHVLRHDGFGANT